MTEDKIREIFSHKELMINFSRNIIKNRQDAEEVVQTAMIKAITRFDTYDPEKSKLSTWLCTITKNEALQLIRHIKSQRTTDIIENFNYIPDEDPDEIDTYMEKYERVVKMAGDLNTLNKIPGLVEDFLCYYMNRDFHIYDIAEKHNLNYDTVRGKFRRAAQQICDRYPKMYPEASSKK